MTRDVIPQFGHDHTQRYQQEIESFLRDIDQMRYVDAIKDSGLVHNMDDFKAMSNDKLSRQLGITNEAHRDEIMKALDKLNDPDRDRQIRHARKFAALVLLGPFDILRNLNVC